MSELRVVLQPIKLRYDGWAEPDGEGGLYLPNNFIKRLLRPSRIAHATADAWQFYNTFPEYMADGTMDLDTDTFKMQLHSSSYTFAATHSVRADLTNELSTAAGYTAGGATMTATWTNSSGTVTFDSNDISWTASGGTITARRAVIYDDTPSSPLDPLVCSSLLDNSPADVSATTGNTLTVAINASGIFASASA